jgi:hypothetical protein
MNMLEIPQGAGSGFLWDDKGEPRPAVLKPRKLGTFRHARVASSGSSYQESAAATR